MNIYFKAKEIVISTVDKLKAIPIFLRILTIVFMCSVLFLLAVIPFPDMSYSINGKPSTYMELWETGAMAIFIALGLLLPIIAYGILNRKGWSRILLIVFVFIPFAHFIYQAFTGNSDYSQIFLSGIYLILFFWYLFLKQNVIYFFNGKVIP